MLTPHIPLENNDFKAGWGRSVVLHRVSCKQYREGLVLTHSHVVCPLRTLQFTGRLLPGGRGIHILGCVLRGGKKYRYSKWHRLRDTKTGPVDILKEEALLWDTAVPEVGPPQSSVIDTHSLDWQSKKEKGHERRHNAKKKGKTVNVCVFVFVLKRGGFRPSNISWGKHKGEPNRWGTFSL